MAPPAYHIQVGDVLEVRLLLNPELNEEVTVRPDGHISTTAVPDMLAYGRSPADLAVCDVPSMHAICRIRASRSWSSCSRQRGFMSQAR